MHASCILTMPNMMEAVACSVILIVQRSRHNNCAVLCSLLGICAVVQYHEHLRKDRFCPQRAEKNVLACKSSVTLLHFAIS